jgi:predicted O-methyltransferase YrrM
MKYKGIQEVELGEVAPDDGTHIYLPVDLAKTGSTPWNDLLVLGKLAQRYQPEVVFEVGTYEGLGGLVICKNSSPKWLFTLDLPNDAISAHSEVSEFAKQDLSVSENFELGKLLPLIGGEVQITQLIGDSWTFDYSDYHDSVDFFYIDGAHTRRYVIRDTQNALKCVREGGLIAWHDARNSQVLDPISLLTTRCSVSYISHSNLCFMIVENKDQGVLDLLERELEPYL